jgi:hypothetical protein
MLRETFKEVCILLLEKIGGTDHPKSRGQAVQIAGPRGGGRG